MQRGVTFRAYCLANFFGAVVMGRMDTRSLLIFLVIGLVAGFLASLIVGGGGLLTYLVSGVIGAFVGGWLFSALKINLRIGSPIVSQIITSTVGAIIVLVVARLIAG
jgi:uncharacterized membrane protein YeaQ/YmgE (transglycosylase-associated protein family)